MFVAVTQAGYLVDFNMVQNICMDGIFLLKYKQLSVVWKHQIS